MDLAFNFDKPNNTFYTIVDGHKAVISYTVRDGVWYLEHTVVPKELSGQGVGSKLAKYVFDYLQENKIKYKSVCSFLVAYEQKHGI